MARFPRQTLLVAGILLALLLLAPDPEAQVDRGYVEQLGSPSEDARRNAIRELGLMGEDSIPLLREAILQGDQESRTSAMAVLRELLIGYDEQAGAAAEQLLAELIESDDQEVVYAARVVLSTFSSRRIEATLEHVRNLGIEIGTFADVRHRKFVPFIVDYVIVDGRCTGGVDEVAPLLGQLPSLRIIYLDDDAGFGREDLLRFDGYLANRLVRTRASACIGIRGQEHPLGFKVDGTDASSGAAEAGLRRGDIITRIAGGPAQFDALMRELAKHRPGDVVECDVLRGLDGRFTVSVRLGTDFGGRSCDCGATEAVAFRTDGN